MAKQSTNAAIAQRRLLNQFITRTGPRQAADLVRWFGAVQAQEYGPAKWGLGQRMRDGTVAADIERAFQEGQILRTHVMRPTWQFVAPIDIRWLLELTAPHVHRILSYYNRRLGLDARTLTRGTAVLERALRDGHYLTRRELAERLQRAGFTLDSIELARVVMHAELEAVICSGPRRDKQFTYALLAERAPKALRLSRDEALAELCRRYFRSHGPATIRDFVWWSGLSSVDTKRGLDMNEARREEVNGLTYWTVGPTTRGSSRQRLVQLLPVYDEYLIAYRDREAVPHGIPGVTAPARALVTFQHALVIAGQVAGMWKATPTARGVRVYVAPLRRLTRPERSALVEAVARYERFVAAPVDLSVRA